MGFAARWRLVDAAMSRTRKTKSQQSRRSHRAVSPNGHGRGTGAESASSSETRDRNRRTGRRRQSGFPDSISSWFRAKLPIMRFVGLFGLFMSLAYVCEITPSIRKHVFPAYLRHNARVSGIILRAMGEDASVHRTSISSPRYAVEVKHGCNALLPTALFVSAVLACPVRFSAKIPGILIGAIVLMLMNLVRIVTMFYAGIHIPGFFRIMHNDVWPTIFVSLSVLLWISWALWARERGGGLTRETG